MLIKNYRQTEYWAIFQLFNSLCISVHAKPYKEKTQINRYAIFFDIIAENSFGFSKFKCCNAYDIYRQGQQLRVKAWQSLT